MQEYFSIFVKGRLLSHAPKTAFSLLARVEDPSLRVVVISTGSQGHCPAAALSGVLTQVRVLGQVNLTILGGFPFLKGFLQIKCFI